MADNVLTIEQYLNGKVRNINVPDDAMRTILADASKSAKEKIEPGSDIETLSEKQCDLATAYLYVWVAGSPTQSGGFSEEDADWKSAGDSERMSASVLKNYLAMANKIFEKYGLDTISTGRWGFVGRGIHNPSVRK